MIQRSLKEVQSMVDGQGLDSAFDSLKINGVTTNSRESGHGKLFIPIVGEKFNAHQFAEQALKDGAAATLWAKNEPNPPQGKPVIFVEDTLTALQVLAKSYREQLSVKVVGVTGSNGKTTTKDLIAAVLQTTFKVHKTKGNFNNHIGLPLTILSMHEDTDVAVLEMGMSGRGEIELLSNLAKPDVGVITNIGESHLQDLGSREGIAEAKLEIVSGLKANGTLIYIGDEPLLTERVGTLPFRKITFGAGEQNDYRATGIKQSAEGSSFQLKGDPFQIPILGKHNVNNALAAIALGHILKLSNETIKQGLMSLQMTGMRLEMSQAANGASIINDAYNASPTSMKAAIRLMEDLDGYQRKIAVLGDMLELGDREKEFHYEVGESISEAIDYVFTYGKLGAEIASGAKQKLAADKVKSYLDKEQLIEDMKEFVQSDDLILVKASRGMRLEEVVEALKA